MIEAILITLSITIFIGLVLGYASIKLKTTGDPIVDKIDKILPQTQCGQCGYPGCKPYASPMVRLTLINAPLVAMMGFINLLTC